MKSGKEIIQSSKSKRTNLMNINLRGINENSVATKAGLSAKSQTSKQTKTSTGYLAGRFLEYHNSTQESSITNREVELSTNRLNVKMSSEALSARAPDTSRVDTVKQVIAPQSLNTDTKCDSIENISKNKKERQIKENNNSIQVQGSENSFNLNKSIQNTPTIKDNLLTSHNSLNIGKQRKSFRSLNSSPLSKNPCNSLIKSIYSSQKLNTKLKDDFEFSQIQKSKTRFIDIKKEDFYSDANSKRCH